MAKATKEDIDAAFLISRILSDVADPRNFALPAFPPRLDGKYHDDDPQSFDWSASEHVEALRERLVGAMKKGSLSRVLFGFETLMNPNNRLVDPDKNYLDFHPRFDQVEKERDALRDALTVSRGQWIHSVNADQCLRALGECLAPVPEAPKPPECRIQCDGGAE